MKHNVPGVYFDNFQSSSNAIKFRDRTIAGFVGLTQMGPMHKPVRIRSYTQFTDMFGESTDYSYLAYAIYGFFNSGGKECVVVRTAHISEDQSNGASNAFINIPCVTGTTDIVIKARSEGSWGNRIIIKIQHSKTCAEKISHISINEMLELKLDNNSIDENYVKGDTLVIRGEHNFEYTKILYIENNVLYCEKLKDETFFERNNISVCENVVFNFTLVYNDIIEEFLNLSPNHVNERYYTDVINKESRFIKINNNGITDILPCDMNNTPLFHGSDGLADITPADFIGYYKGLQECTGLGIFEKFDDIDIIAAPDVHIFEDIIYNKFVDGRDAIFTVQKAMVDQCERFGNRFAILDAPTVKDTFDLKKWRDKFDSSFASVYYPRIDILDPADSSGLITICIPPSGHIAGIFSLCDSEEGVFRAPANKFIKGAVGLNKSITNGDYEMLNPSNINCLKYIPGKGIKVWGARTLSSDSSWRYINVRRTFSAIKDAIKSGTGWAVFETNNIQLRKRMIRHITAFLIDIWRKGFLAGKTPEEAFFVKCDDTNNYKETIDAGILNVEIGVSISKPAEFLMIKLSAKSDNSTLVMEE